MSERQSTITMEEQDNGLWSVYEINGLYAENTEESKAHMYVRELLIECKQIENKGSIT